MPDAAAIFLDGGYVDKVRQYDFGGRSFDFQKLVERMAAPETLLRAYYYHCMPYQSPIPTEDESRRYSSMHKFVSALRRLPRFEVRLGRLVYRGGEYMQKRVDTMFGVDMALLAGKGKINRMALFTGDSDLIPAVEAVKREGVVVTLWHGGSSRTRPSNELYELCDDRVEVDQRLFEEVCRPALDRR
jgi:uncharacterized LabA/DUF88 family protein